MKRVCKYLIFVVLYITTLYEINAQSNVYLSISKVIDTLSLEASDAKIKRLGFENELLQFENYKKSFLPSASLNLSPVGFNRSIVKLQQATDGQYNYVEDYSSSSSAGISLQQKLPFTGGTISASTSLNYLSELSQNRNSFSATPFAISYSQQLFGERKIMQFEKNIEYKKHEETIKKYCLSVSGIQQKALNLFMEAFLASLEKTLSSSNRLATDSLYSMAKVRYENNRITELDFKQIALQATNNEYLEANAAKNHEDAVRTLMTYLDILIHENINDVIIETPEFTLPLQMNPENVKYYIMKNNPELLSRDIQKLEAQKGLYSSEINNRFNANINLSYGMNQYARTLDKVYSNPSIQQSVSIGFSVPFSLWGINRNNAQIAKNNYQSFIISMEKEIEEFENKIHKTINNYNHNINLWIIAERSYQLAQEQYKLTVQEFAMGRSSAYELIASQQEQSTALQNYYNVVRNAYEIYFQLREMALYDFEKEIELIDIFLNH